MGPGHKGLSAVRPTGRALASNIRCSEMIVVLGQLRGKRLAQLAIGCDSKRFTAWIRACLLGVPDRYSRKHRTTIMFRVPILGTAFSDGYESLSHCLTLLGYHSSNFDPSGTAGPTSDA